MGEASRKGFVYIQDRLAGEVCETDDGYTFFYYEDYISSTDAVAASLTLPIQKEAYMSNVLFPFFDGIIPEGWLLDAVVHNWKIESNDRFGLLLAACRDCVGDVSVRTEKI